MAMTSEETVLEKIEEMEKNLGILKSTVKTNAIATPRGRTPQILNRLHQIMSNRFGYKDGLTIDEPSKTVYGSVDYETKQKTRVMLSLLRKKYGVIVYSVLPLGKGFKRRFCILNNTLETKQVRKNMNNIQNGLIKQEEKVKRWERKIKDGSVKIASKQEAQKVKTNE